MLSFNKIVTEQQSSADDPAANQASHIILAPLTESFQSHPQLQHQDHGALAPLDSKLERLQARLVRLEKGTLPEFQRCRAALEAEFEERQKAARDWYQLRCELINKEHTVEKNNAKRELESRRQELRDLLLAELKEKRRAVELERANFDLNFDGDVHDVKQPATWRLRNRQPAKAAASSAKDAAIGQLDASSATSAAAAALLAVAASGGDASSSTGGMSVLAAAAAAGCAGGSGGGGGVATSSIASGASAAAAAAANAANSSSSIGPLWSVLGGGGSGFDPLLPDADIQDDLRVIAKARQQRSAASSTAGSTTNSATGAAAAAAAAGGGGEGATPAAQLQVVDGVLFYRDRSFTRGVHVSLETRRTAKYSGTIVNVSQQEVIIKRSSDGGKMKVSLKHLRTGKFILKRLQNS